MQPQNATLPIFVTPFGITTFVTELQFFNAQDGIESIPYSNSTLLSFVAPEKTLSPLYSPILVTVLGILIDVIAVPVNVSPPIDFNPRFSFTFERFLHQMNALSLIVSTLPGISIDVRPVQPSNAYLSIYVTLLGISIDVKPVQP